MALFELKVEIPAAQANQADEVLLECAGEGWSVLEDAIAKRAWIAAIAPEAATVRQQWENVRAALVPAGVEPMAEPQIRELADRDWRDSYKDHFKPSRFGRLHWVPVWERESYRLPAGDAVLWLDPGLAFGTGNHETTRLCVERLVGLVSCIEKQDTPRRVIDAGCGSGILALSAVLLGFREVVGFDNDPEAVRVSEENATLNGLQGRVTFLTADLVTGLAGRQADVLLANIQADVLMRFAHELIAAVAPGGALILSGILAVERDQVRTAFAAAAPAWTIESRVLGEWSDLALRRPGDSR